ncbi:MAG: SpoIIE family protein phosphatase [Planctomycetes bacterium]|nr:SpoIIE family protein phosphatase [Planctomycetota bacterium]
MPAASELRTVAERTAAFGLLRHHAVLRGCDVEVFDADGVRVGPSSDATCRTAPASRAPSPVSRQLDASAPVHVFDRLVGHVVATPRADEMQTAFPADVAARGAALLADLCSREFELNDLSREILGAYEELNLFYELSADFAVATDAAAISRVIVAKACRAMNVASAWVLLADVNGTLRPAASIDPPRGAGDVPSGAGAAGRAMATRRPDLADETTAGRASDSSSDAVAGWERSAVGAMLTVPLTLPGTHARPPFGVLQAVARVGADAFSSGEVKLATALASHAAVLLENQRLIEMEREMRLARTIQQSLLPAKAPDVPGLDVAGRCIPAANVGGDYYDHFLAADGSLALVVADVSGHNLAAALVQTAARSTIRAQGMTASGPALALDGSNRALFDDLTRSDMFLTAWFATVDGRTGRVVHADAGHAPALVYRAASQTVDEVAAGGLPIGIVPDGEFAQGETTLAPGDVLVAYTDGLTEARSPVETEEYGADRLAAALRSNAHLDASGIADALLADVSCYDGGGTASDDRSVVVVKMRARVSR